MIPIPISRRKYDFIHLLLYKKERVNLKFLKDLT